MSIPLILLVLFKALVYLPVHLLGLWAPCQGLGQSVQVPHPEKRLVALLDGELLRLTDAEGLLQDHQAVNRVLLGFLPAILSVNQMAADQH